jgi:hypothetical protein
VVARKDSFKAVVQKAWSIPCSETNSLDIWQFRMRTFRRLTRGWASNVAKMNKQKVSLAEEFNSLDRKAELSDLTSIEKEILKVVTNKLNEIWAFEEIKSR